jgi:polysaccharide biosynthesis/export protein
MKISPTMLVIACLYVSPFNGFAQRTAPAQTPRDNTRQPATSTASTSQPLRAGDGTAPPESKSVDITKPADDQHLVGPEYVIGAEDVLGVWVWHEPDFTRKVFVRPDGKIGLPFLKEIHAAGLTTSELAERIKEEAKRLLSDPEVSVTVEEIRSQVVNLLGAVAKPGVYPLGSPLTIVDLLARAGGLTEFAKTDEILILRREGQFMSTRYIFNYNEFLNNKNLRQNLELKNQDTVIVRE